MTQEIDAGVYVFTSEFWRQIPHCSTNDRGFNEKVKVILKLEIRQSASMGKAGKTQTGWVVCKVSRKLGKRLHSESGDQSVQLWFPQLKKDTKNQERVQRSAMIWPLSSDWRKSFPLRKLRGNLITLFQWLFLGNCKEDSVSTWGTTWRRKGELVTIYTRKGFILLQEEIFTVRIIIPWINPAWSGRASISGCFSDVTWQVAACCPLGSHKRLGWMNFGHLFQSGLFYENEKSKVGFPSRDVLL